MITRLGIPLPKIKCSNVVGESAHRTFYLLTYLSVAVHRVLRGMGTASSSIFVLTGLVDSTSRDQFKLRAHNFFTLAAKSVKGLLAQLRSFAYERL